MPAWKYTKEVIAPVVADSTSYAEVIRKLGAKWSAGQHQNIQRRVREYGLDTSHFIGKGSNRGAGHKGGPARRCAEEILVKRDREIQPRQNITKIRRALLEIGRQYVCEQCGLGPEWAGMPLTLQVDHIDGDRWNDEAVNLRFLCPNCHSQTETFGHKNIGGRGGTVYTQR